MNEKLQFMRLKNLAIYHFRRVKSNCTYLKMHAYDIDEEGNYEFYALFRCKRTISLKKVILTPKGKLIAIISL